MLTRTSQPEPLVLPSHLAAACIFARRSHHVTPVQSSSGVLRELEVLLRAR
jgi:hypothetical protein